MTSAQLREFLSRTPFFGGLDAHQLDRVASMLKAKDVARGTVIFTEGEQGRSMYVVESGELVARQAGGQGRDVKLMRMRAGDFFGETTLIEMQPRPFTVLAETDARLHELTNMDLYNLYKQDVNAYVMVLQNINRELCRRLRGASNRLADIADDEDVTQITTPVPRPR